MGVELFGGMSGEFFGGHLPLAPRTPLLVGLFNGLLNTAPLILTPEIFNSFTYPFEKMGKFVFVLPGALFLDQVLEGSPAHPLDSRQLPLQVWVPLRALDLLEGAGVFVATLGLQDLILEGP